VFLAPRDRGNVVEQIASGVLLSLGGETFVLTAGHVVDELDRGHLPLGWEDFGLFETLAEGGAAQRRGDAGSTRPSRT
jgi:hypothetical protein